MDPILPPLSNAVVIAVAVISGVVTYLTASVMISVSDAVIVIPEPSKDAKPASAAKRIGSALRILLPILGISWQTYIADQNFNHLISITGGVTGSENQLSSLIILMTMLVVPTAMITAHTFSRYGRSHLATALYGYPPPP